MSNTISEIDTLFTVPMDPKITDGCDSGQPIVVTHPDSSQVIHLIVKILLDISFTSFSKCFQQLFL